MASVLRIELEVMCICIFLYFINHRFTKHGFLIYDLDIQISAPHFTEFSLLLLLLLY